MLNTIKLYIQYSIITTLMCQFYLANTDELLTSSTVGVSDVSKNGLPFGIKTKFMFYGIDRYILCEVTYRFHVLFDVLLNIILMM